MSTEEEEEKEENKNKNNNHNNNNKTTMKKVPIPRSRVDVARFDRINQRENVTPKAPHEATTS